MRPELAPSWYAASVPESPALPALEGRHEADVGILGAGFTGLSAALELAEAGYRVAVLEAERVGFGASGRNGGQVIFGYSCDHAKLRKHLGEEDALRAFQWSLEGLDLIHQRCARYGIDADWRAGHAHVAIKPRQVHELKAWQADLAEHCKFNLPWWGREQLREQLDSPRYLGALFDARSGHLHPLKYCLGLAEAARSGGVRIFEQSKVQRMSRGSKPVLHTASGELHCSQVLLAGNALVRGIAPELDRKIMPVGTYIAATAPLGEARARALIRNDMAVADLNWAVDYFRLSADHRLLFGGRASYSNLPPPGLGRVMRGRMQQVFPQLEDAAIEYLWGGMIDISLNRTPHWGRLDPNVYFAQGYSGHGINTSQLAGRLIAECMRGQHERLDVFERITHHDFPGGRLLRMPLLAISMAWFKLRDALW